MTKSVQDGMRAEKLFAHSYHKIDPEAHIVYPTRIQNMNEHWDISINGHKYDVKAVKKLNRFDTSSNEEIIWIELRNVQGRPGWLYGHADYLAFEIEKGFMIVDRILLSKKVEALITPDEGKGLYKTYSREGRKDLLTLINKDDIKDIITKIVYK